MGLKFIAQTRICLAGRLALISPTPSAPVFPCLFNQAILMELLINSLFISAAGAATDMKIQIFVYKIIFF